MRFDVITIFPEALQSYFSTSILKRAQEKKLIKVHLHNLRNWTRDRHRTVDDKPYGGGAGMVMKAEPILKAVEALKQRGKRGQRDRRGKPLDKARGKPYVILFSAKGKILTQEKVRKLAKKKHLILICGHYEGVDERVAKYLADEELSIGEYVLTGGEIPAMAVVDAVSRLLPGVLGKAASLEEESFSQAGFREYPHYTRPEVLEYKGKRYSVPKVLLSGDHKKIGEWRRKHTKG